MKKSLVALAVLAASGAAMAQVSITGNLTAGFQSSTDASNNTASGLGVDNAQIIFSATEDLGGGLKASAKLGLVDVARGPVSGRTFGPGDTELAISGGFGKLALSTTREVDYLSGGVAGIGGTYMHGRVFDNRITRDSVSYSVPLGPVSVGLTYSEAPSLLGLGTGTSGNTLSANDQVFGSRQVGLNVRYADDKKVIDFGILSNEADGAKSDDGHVRFSTAYDHGFAKLGFAFENQSYKAIGTGQKTSKRDAMVALSVPVGAATLSGNWAQREWSNNPATDGTQTGYGLKASYALSKRTAVSADYTNWNGVTNSKVDANKQSQYNFLLSHSF